MSYDINDEIRRIFDKAIPDRPSQPPHLAYSAPEVDLGDKDDLKSIGVPERIASSVAALMRCKSELEIWKRIGDLDHKKVSEMLMDRLDTLHKDLRILAEEAE